MATRRKKPDEGGGFVGRLAERGEEAVTRLVDELSKSPRVTDAVEKAMSAKGKVDAGARRTLSQVGLAAADELKDLRKQIERLESRLARLEGGGTTGTRKAPRTTAKRTETKRKPTTRKRTTTTVKKDAEKATSPDAGRSIGGGSGRGSSPGGGPAAA
jgi:polyhydroxyalkanoate synthesis regulator phasin